MKSHSLHLSKHIVGRNIGPVLRTGIPLRPGKLASRESDP